LVVPFGLASQPHIAILDHGSDLFRAARAPIEHVGGARGDLFVIVDVLEWGPHLNVERHRAHAFNALRRLFGGQLVQIIRHMSRQGDNAIADRHANGRLDTGLEFKLCRDEVADDGV
jgi:hypothetical protein